ncbi:cinnamoyl-CoA reductase 1-like [Prosopis cineraria]|uniref:cinnamoyl-CoA reductase 1-like n=1 Tax=Prosopis cineraria TaxID=364024 RepID=UPI002410A8CC|nr:cinnamoyl-CoA reductase 1-like [Prosopis cineraria]XP_054818607.1 cinnamoyl-CoA reductase 1-like [Prosopis cineraria]
MSKVVCVTGASGAIGSWVVRLLLERGYTVHATVQDLNDDNETKHLEAMEGAKSRLHLFEMDLLDMDSIKAAVEGCAGVFHLACPNIIGQVQDPEKQIVEPATKGTVNVLKAAKEAGVERVVATSSISSIMPSPGWPSDRIKDEECWTDLDYCKRKGLWYPIAKTLAEKAGWQFAKETGCDVVMINPGTALGPLIPSRVNASMAVLLGVLKGDTETYEDFFMGMAHFKDVAMAHVLAFEKKEASGRHLCVEAIRHYGDFVEKVAELYPDYNVAKVPQDTQPGLLRAKDASKKLINLGMTFTPIEQIITDAVESLKSKGFL